MATSLAEKKGLSPDAQKWIGVGAVLACLLLGAGIVWFFLVGTTPRERKVTVDPKLQSAGVEGRLPGDRSRLDWPGVHRLNPTRWQVTSKTGILYVVKEKQGYRFSYDFTRGFIPPEQVALLSSLVRAQVDAAMATSWGLTDGQVKQLRKINLRQRWLRPSAEDEAAIKSLWDAYVQAGQPGGASVAPKNLVEKLDAVAKANLEAGKKLFAERIDAAKKVLTADQLQKMTAR